MHAIVGANDTSECKTMNELMKKSGADISLDLLKDVPISRWAALSDESKHRLHPQAGEVDAILKVEIELCKVKCSWLVDYHELLSVGKVDKDLHGRQQHPLEHVLEAWIDRVIDTPDKSKLAPNAALARRRATTVFTRNDPPNPFESGPDKEELKMLGRDNQMNDAMGAMAFIGPYANDPAAQQKEANKIVRRRQGKSLLLDCLAEQVDARGHASLTMTFNSPTALSREKVISKRIRECGSSGDACSGRWQTASMVVRKGVASTCCRRRDLLLG